jgi:predicted nucleotidyltransferase
MIQTTVGEWEIAPVSLVLFGSAARRDGDADSDVDLLLIRPDDLGSDNEGWSDQLYELAGAVERWTGNTVQFVELSKTEFEGAVRRAEPLVEHIMADGVTLAGRSLLDIAVGA